jgi:hypothetical protein
MTLCPAALGKTSTSSKTYSTTPNCDLAGYNAAGNTTSCKTCMTTYKCEWNRVPSDRIGARPAEALFVLSDRRVVCHKHQEKGWSM